MYNNLLICHINVNWICCFLMIPYVVWTMYNKGICIVFVVITRYGNDLELTGETNKRRPFVTKLITNCLRFLFLWGDLLVQRLFQVSSLIGNFITF